MRVRLPFMTSIGKKVPDEYVERFEAKRLKSNQMRSLIATVALAVAVIVQLMVFPFNTDFVTVFTLLAMVAIAVLIVWMFRVKKQRTIGKIQLSGLIICAVWAMLITFDSFETESSLIAYLIGILGVGMLFYLRPRVSVTLILCMHAVYIAMNVMTIQSSHALVGNVVDSSIIVVFAITHSVNNYYALMHEFLNQILMDDLNDANRKLQEIAVIDPGTEIPNRRAFQERVRIEWSNAMRVSEPLSILMIDIDSFKQYNDHYGHIKGDMCLRDVARSISDSITRTTDFAARFGGEEFIVLLPHTDADGAKIMAETIRHNVEQLQILHEKTNVDSKTVTVSVGVATMTPDHNQEASALVELADSALYESKRSGKNRVTVARPASKPREMEERA